ncbi:hypothetical protein D3C76_1315650 [compost metagenome]
MPQATGFQQAIGNPQVRVAGVVAVKYAPLTVLVEAPFPGGKTMAEIALREIVSGPGQQPFKASPIVGHQRKKQPIALPFRCGYLLRGGRINNPPIITDHVLFEVFPSRPNALVRTLRRPCQD